MEPDRMEGYRRILEDLREELRASVSGSAGDIAPVQPDPAIGRLTRQDAMLSQQMAMELRRRNQVRLGQIELALQRMDRGEYGVCARCEEEIPAARLRVRPEAQVCVRCAERG